MSWETVKPGEVSGGDEGGYPDLQPEQGVTAQLLPVATTRMGRGDNPVEELVTRAAITEGPQKGRQFFLQYPDPTAANGKFAWAAKAVGKLLFSLGIDLQEGESVQQALNRAASNGHSLFKIDLIPDPKGYIPQGKTSPKTIPGLFSVAPAA